jgi:transposase
MEQMEQPEQVFHMFQTVPHNIYIMKIKVYSKTELSRMYNVHYDTFKKWLKNVPDLDLKPAQRILTPKQVEKIFKHLGEPD